MVIPSRGTLVWDEYKITANGNQLWLSLLFHTDLRRRRGYLRRTDSPFPASSARSGNNYRQARRVRLRLDMVQTPKGR